PPAQRSPGGCSALIGRRGFGFPGARVGARRAASLRLGSGPRARSPGASPSVPCVPVLSPGGQDDHPTPRPAVQAEDGVSAEGKETEASEDQHWKNCRCDTTVSLQRIVDTTLMSESEEELKGLLMKVKEKSEKVGFKLSIQKMKIMASGPITPWEIDGETVESVRLYLFGLQNHHRW
uniref:Uncharacterized protein n=1 Tax=Ovis aries TaxID=9940 RepID=A0AC11D2L2_SHEEP